MVRYLIIDKDKGNIDYESILRRDSSYLPRLFSGFYLNQGAGLKTPLEGLVLDDDVTESGDEAREEARYIISVDLRNQWVMQKEHRQGKETPKAIHPETLAKIEDKYGSEREYRTIIRRFLAEEFLELFFPFFDDASMTYSPYSGLCGGLSALGGVSRAASFMIDDENIHQSGKREITSRVIVYIRGAQFYVSEDEFSLKANMNAWSILPSIHIRKKVDSEEYEYSFVKTSNAKFWSNPLASFSHSPKAFESFVEMLRKGPKDTTFAIGDGHFETTRFFTSQDPVTMLMQDYLSGNDWSKPDPVMNERIQTMITSLRERQMLMHDPSIETQLSEEKIVELRKKYF